MLRAHVHVASPDLVLQHTRDEVPQMRFEVAYQAVSDVIFLTAEGQDFPRLEAALEDDTTVSEFVNQAEYADRRVYKLTVDVDRPVISQVAAEHGISVADTRSEPGDTGWSFELVFPSREALGELKSFCTEHGVEFSVERLFYPENPGGGGEGYGLTDTQRETLQVAFERGYFEVPRGTSQQELAEHLDSSPTAVSGRIRRAVANLVANTVAEPDEE